MPILLTATVNPLQEGIEIPKFKVSIKGAALLWKFRQSPRFLILALEVAPLDIAIHVHRPVYHVYSTNTVAKAAARS